MGLFLVRLLRSSEITFEQTRVDDGIWMTERVEVLAAAKILFVSSLMIDPALTYSEYRLAEADALTTRDRVNTIHWAYRTRTKKLQRSQEARVSR